MIDSKKLFLVAILASATLTIMAGSVIAPALNVMRDGLGVSPSSVGLIITTHGLFMALFSPLMGSVIDKIGVRRPFIFSLICYGLAGGSGLLINSYWVLLVSRACLGIALSGIFVCLNVLILNRYKGGDRDKVMGWRGSDQQGIETYSKYDYIFLPKNTVHQITAKEVPVKVVIIHPDRLE